MNLGAPAVERRHRVAQDVVREVGLGGEARPDAHLAQVGLGHRRRGVGDGGLQPDRVSGVLDQHGAVEPSGGGDVLAAVVDGLLVNHPELGRVGLAGDLERGAPRGQAVAGAGEREHQGAQVQQVPGVILLAAFEPPELLDRPLGIQGFDRDPRTPAAGLPVRGLPHDQGEPAVHVGAGLGGVDGQAGPIEGCVEHDDRGGVAAAVVRVADVPDPLIDELRP